MRQGVEIKHWNIDCICDSETLGAVCVMAGFENQWIRAARSGRGQRWICPVTLSLARLILQKQNICKNMPIMKDSALCVLVTSCRNHIGVLQVWSEETCTAPSARGSVCSSCLADAIYGTAT